MPEKETTINREFLQTQVVESSYDIRDYRIVAGTNFPETFELPKRVNVKNQEAKPTCVAHALSSLVEYHNLIETGKYRKFSTEFILFQQEAPASLGGGGCHNRKKQKES